MNILLIFITSVLVLVGGSIGYLFTLFIDGLNWENEIENEPTKLKKHSAVNHSIYLSMDTTNKTELKDLNKQTKKERGLIKRDRIERIEKSIYSIYNSSNDINKPSISERDKERNKGQKKGGKTKGEKGQEKGISNPFQESPREKDVKTENWLLREDRFSVQEYSPNLDKLKDSKEGKFPYLEDQRFISPCPHTTEKIAKKLRQDIVDCFGER